jgi:endonuclease/exonuclease/phosphatase family metal-dependent hydrolase
MRPTQFISVATYNVHGWTGTDGFRDPARTMQVIRELRADIVGLQEATFPFGGEGEFTQDDLGRGTGLQVVLGPTFFKEDVNFGNALLANHPIGEVRRLDLSLLAREPRGALDVDLDVGGIPVRVLVTHLGLRPYERRYQVKGILDALSSEFTGLVVLVGDFNEWSPARLSLRRLRNWFGYYPPAPPTFPSRFPVLPLNRIWVRPRTALLSVRAQKTSLARVASDHLPLKGALRAQ